MSVGGNPSGCPGEEARQRVCPWWMCFTFDNPLRKLIHNPYRMLGPYVHEGDTAVDVGPGMGYFSIPMARMAGPRGRVIAVDLQEKMLTSLTRRASRAGMQERIFTQQCTPEFLGVTARADFILTFWMVHEVPNQARFLAELRSVLRDSGRLLLVEPRMHVSEAAFERTVECAKSAGLLLRDRPRVRLSRAALFGPGPLTNSSA